MAASVDSKSTLYPAKVGCLVALALLVGLIGTCGVLLNEMTTTRVRTYKPVEVVRRGDREELRRRGTPLDLPGATLSAEWYTYDNEVINQPPYKLSIDLQAADDGVERIEIVEIELQSSRGRTYAFADTIAWPLVLRPGDRESVSGKLEPAFEFGYAEGEEIVTMMRVRVVGPAGARMVVLRTHWVPVMVSYFSPIV
jgi:hypothetical protein